MTDTTPGKNRVEVRGVSIDVSADAFDDFDFLDRLARLQDGDALALPALFRTVCGSASAEALEALRDPETGRVAASDAAAFMTEVMGAVAPKP